MPNEGCSQSSTQAVFFIHDNAKATAWFGSMGMFIYLDSLRFDLCLVVVLHGHKIQVVENGNGKSNVNSLKETVAHNTA